MDAIKKTIFDDFKEKYPNAPLEVSGEPTICPYQLGYFNKSDSPCEKFGYDYDCVSCWNRPIEGE